MAALNFLSYPFADNALRLVRRYSLVANGISPSQQDAAPAGSHLRGGRCITLNTGQYAALADLAGARFRQLYNSERPHGLGGAEVFRMAVQHLDRADAGLPQLRWYSDGAPVHAPVGANRRGVSHHLGPPVRRRNSSLSLSADEADQIAWRSLLYCTSAALVGAEVGCISQLYLTTDAIRLACRHSKDSGVSADQFYAGLLVQVLRGRVTGQVWRPRRDGSPVPRWWERAAAVLRQCAAYEVLIDYGGVAGPALRYSPDAAPALCRDLAEQWRASVLAGPSPVSVPVFIENPYGMLRLRPYMVPLSQHMRVVTYCAYGTAYRKRTCVWALRTAWVGRPVCRFRCGSCMANHSKCGRYTHSDTIGQDVGHRRSDSYSVPEPLLREVVQSVADRGGTGRRWALEMFCGPNQGLRSVAHERGWVYVGVDQDARLSIYGSLHPGADSYVLCLGLATVTLQSLLRLVCSVLGLSEADLQMVWVRVPPSTTLLPSQSPHMLPAVHTLYWLLYCPMRLCVGG
jgi:hypothetical protein